MNGEKGGRKLKFVWKGKMKSMEELPKADLPQNAVKYKEPENAKDLNKKAMIFIIPVILIMILGVAIRNILYGEMDIDFFNGVGALLAFLMILPHEFLHAIAFPKEAEVECWYIPKQLLAFVVSTYPVPKRQFIFLSLLPNLVFGFIPFLIWIIVPTDNKVFLDTLYCFSTLSMLFGAGDYMNVYNTIKQVPTGAMTQLSGFNSYWYIPEKG